MAVKELQQPFDPRSNKQGADFDREVTFMKSVRHPHVLTFYGAGITSELYPFLVVELMEQGSLYALLNDHSRALSWRDRVQFALDVASGMRYLHGMDTVHRDLKSDNCFVSADMRVKVGDFGTGRILETVDTSSSSGALTTQAGFRRSISLQSGSLLWMAPEILDLEAAEQHLMWAADVYR